MAKGTPKTAINKVKKERNLPPDYFVSLEIVCQRIPRESIFVAHCGHISPLVSIEPIVVSTIKQMCRIHHCLTPTQGIALVNSMIEDMEA